MIPMTLSADHAEIQNYLATLLGKECWYVSAGRNTGSHFLLSLGGKEPRSIPIKNSKHTEEYRNFEGEASLYVICCWRLDATDGPITNSYEPEEVLGEALKVLIGEKVCGSAVQPPAWDLCVEFTGGFALRVFCHHAVAGSPINWYLRPAGGHKPFSVGPGYCWTVETTYTH